MKAHIYSLDRKLPFIHNYEMPMGIEHRMCGEELVLMMWREAFPPVGTNELAYIEGKGGMFIFENESDYISFSEWMESISERFGGDNILPSSPPDGSYGGMSIISIRPLMDQGARLPMHESGIEKNLISALIKCIVDGKGEIFFFNNRNGTMKLFFTDEPTAMIFRCMY